MLNKLNKRKIQLVLYCCLNQRQRGGGVLMLSQHFVARIFFRTLVNCANLIKVEKHYLYMDYKAIHIRIRGQFYHCHKLYFL